MDLITTMGVSSTKASEVVKVVLQRLGRSKIGRLPSQSFCKYMVLEARQVSLQHLQSTLLSENNLTLCTDATSKFGHKYGTAGIFLKDGTRLHLGVREQASGSAQCTFDTVREMIHDVVSSGGEEVSDFCEKDIFSKIKNLMSDRASTEKRFNEILAQYRASILPDIVEDFDQCSEVEKARLCVVNELFCGLHLIDGLAHQANTALSTWEDMVFGSAEIGSSRHPGFQKSCGESGAVHLLRIVCKLIQERCCEKSGKPVKFRTFLMDRNGTDFVPLAPFKGNRANVIFYNSAGLYFLSRDILD